MFRYDLHVHTAEVSPCANVFAKDVVESYKKAGYHGICITDHYYQTFFQTQKGSWEASVDAFLTGYRTALQYGKETGLFVMLGMEVRLANAGNNEYLVYGLTEEFLYENPRLYELDLLSFCKKIRHGGMMLYQAHPLRPGLVLVDRGLLDGVEGYNGNPRHNSQNETITHYATQQNIPMISGSDFHEFEDLARGGIATELELSSTDLLLSTLRSGNYHLIQT